MNREQFIAQLARLLQDLPPAERQEAIRYYQEYFDDAGEENEDAVIQELGSPGKVVASIKANLQYGGSTFGANDTDMENTGTESQTKDADGWQNADTQGQNGQQGTWQNADTQGQSGQQQTWQNRSTQSPYAMQARKPKRGVGGWALLIIILVFASPMLLGVGGGALGIFIGILATVFALWISFFAVAIGMIGGGIAVLNQRDPSCDQFTGSRTGKHGRRSDLHRTGNLMRSIFPVVYLSAVSACITYHAEFYLKNRT